MGIQLSKSDIIQVYAVLTLQTFWHDMLHSKVKGWFIILAYVQITPYAVHLMCVFHFSEQKFAAWMSFTTLELLKCYLLIKLFLKKSDNYDQIRCNMFWHQYGVIMFIYWFIDSCLLGILLILDFRKTCLLLLWKTWISCQRRQSKNTMWKWYTSSCKSWLTRRHEIRACLKP